MSFFYSVHVVLFLFNILGKHAHSHCGSICHVTVRCFKVDGTSFQFFFDYINFERKEQKINPIS